MRTPGATPVDPEAIRLKRQLIQRLPKFADVVPAQELGDYLYELANQVREGRTFEASNEMEMYLCGVTEAAVHRDADKDDVSRVLEYLGRLLDGHGYAELEKRRPEISVEPDS